MQPIPRSVRLRRLFRQVCFVLVLALISFQASAQYRKVKDCFAGNATATFSPALTDSPKPIVNIQGNLPLQSCNGDPNEPAPKSVVFTGVVPLMACYYRLQIVEPGQIINNVGSGTITWRDDTTTAAVIRSVDTNFNKSNTLVAMKLTGGIFLDAGTLHRRIEIAYSHPVNGGLCSTSGIQEMRASATVTLYEPCLPGTAGCTIDLPVIP